METAPTTPATSDLHAVDALVAASNDLTSTPPSPPPTSLAATGTATTTTTTTTTRRPRHYLIVNNVQKTKNIKNMLLSASAFGVHEVLVVGQKKLDLDEHAALLRRLRCPVSRLASLRDCRDYCQARSVRIVGVEILESARSIDDEPFLGDTAFIMGNEGSGMNAAQTAICDDFVYIPQYGGGTASLNVTVAASIILQSFALWAQLPAVTDAAAQ
jgi:tRNA G18 (ribose-2'-O)-methylase SpoU